MRHIDFGVPDARRRHRELARRRELDRERRLAEAYDERSGVLPRERGVLSREPDIGAAVSSIGVSRAYGKNMHMSRRIGCIKECKLSGLLRRLLL